LFLRGQRLNGPHRSGPGNGNGGSSGSDEHAGQFLGKPHPTFFRFDRLKAGETLSRSAEHGRRCRVRFATDVQNDYFLRDSNRGRYRVAVLEGPLEGKELTTSINLFNGVANWSIAIPEEDTAPGDCLTVQFSVEDDVLLEPIVNVARISLAPQAERPRGTAGERDENSSGREQGNRGAGNGAGSNGDGNEQPAGLKLPNIIPVKREGWDERGFDEKSACTVIADGDGQGETEHSVYTFYVNVENTFLVNDLKHGNSDPALLEAKFIYANVLVGLAMIHDRSNGRSNGAEADPENTEREAVSKRIERETRALAPFLVPMVDYLGRLEPEDVAQLAKTGDEE
jgi:hypothetical protein